MLEVDDNDDDDDDDDNDDHDVIRGMVVNFLQPAFSTTHCCCLLTATTVCACLLQNDNVSTIGVCCGAVILRNSCLYKIDKQPSTVLVVYQYRLLIYSSTCKMRHLTVIVVLMVTVRTQSRDPYANVDWKGLKSGGYAVVTEKDDGAPTTYNSKTGWSSGGSGFVVYNKPADPPMTKEEQEKYDELVRLLSPTGSDSTKKKKSASSEELTKSEQEKYDFLKKHLTPASPSATGTESPAAKPTARPSSSRYGGRYGTGPSPSLSRPSYRRFSSTNPTEETETAKPSTTTSPYDTRPSITSPTTTRFNFNWRTPSTSPTSTLTDTTQPEQPSSPTSPYDTRPSSPSTSGYDTRPSITSPTTTRFNWRTPSTSPTSSSDTRPSPPSTSGYDTRPSISSPMTTRFNWRTPSTLPTSPYDTRPSSPSTSGYDTRPSSPSTSPFDTRPSSPSTSGYDTRPSITSPTTNPYNWRTPLPNLAVLNKDEFNRRFPADKSFIIEKRKQMGLE